MTNLEDKLYGENLSKDRIMTETCRLTDKLESTENLINMFI